MSATKTWLDSIPKEFVEGPTQIVGCRSPKRIKQLTKRLRKIWLKNPSISLSLLVGANELQNDEAFFKDMERIYGR